MVECQPSEEIAQSSCQVHCQLSGEPATCQSVASLPSSFIDGDATKPLHSLCYSLSEPEVPGNETGKEKDSVRDSFGYCSSTGSCLPFKDVVSSNASWYVGLGIFVVCYILLTVLAVWIYCMYCRGKRPKEVAEDLVKREKVAKHCDG